MLAFLTKLLLAARSRLKSRASLEAENLVLRQLVILLSRRFPSRVLLRNLDRLIFVWLYRFFPSILNAITVVKPETVIRRHRRTAIDSKSSEVRFRGSLRATGTCACRKPKPAHSDDVVRRESVPHRFGRAFRGGGNSGRLSPGRDVSAPRYSSERKSSGSGAGAPRRTPKSDPSIRAGSSR